ncbi:helix-turn-helix domain-containing protein [Caulobacter sp.]|uniref:helix-turn-helix domain-containing protein n=1 Tax=Caulobacter sp. TaxID=78 RepID=UPI003BAF7E59
MSNEALTWAFSNPDLPSGAKFVLVALADRGGDHSGEDWTCFPSVERIMKMTNQSRATVERHLATLVAEGWVSRKRRKAANGRLGIYDYVLHRTQKQDDKVNSPVENPADHTSNCSMVEGGDHASNCDPAMPQIEGQPCLKLQHVREPSVEPSDKPSERARPSDADFEEAGARILSAWGEHQHLSSVRVIAKALRAESLGGADLAQVEAACLHYAARKSMWGASGKPVSPQKFITEGRWETIAAVVLAAGVAPEAPTRTGFANAEVRAAVVRAKGEAWAASWLDPCGWRESDRVIIPGLGLRAAELRKVSGLLASERVVIGE